MPMHNVYTKLFPCIEGRHDKNDRYIMAFVYISQLRSCCSREITFCMEQRMAQHWGSENHVVHQTISLIVLRAWSVHLYVRQLIDGIDM